MIHEEKIEKLCKRGVDEISDVVLVVRRIEETRKRLPCQINLDTERVQVDSLSSHRLAIVPAWITH